MNVYSGFFRKMSVLLASPLSLASRTWWIIWLLSIINFRKQIHIISVSAFTRLSSSLPSNLHLSWMLLGHPGSRMNLKRILEKIILIERLPSPEANSELNLSKCRKPHHCTTHHRVTKRLLDGSYLKLTEVYR